MLKFLRKYSKTIMVVFGSVLMVIFLLPSSLRGLGNDASNMPVGTAGDRKIHMDDLREADAMIKLLTEIGLPVRMPGLFPYRLHERNEALHWVLLMIEAERQGIYVSRGEATAMRKSFASGENMPPDRLQAILLRNKVKEAFLDKAIQQMQMIRQLQIKLITFRYPSTPLLQHTALDHLMKLELELVPVKAEEAVKDIKEPTEEELKAQYEKFKTDLPGTSKPHGFGYRLPTRVKMEYLSIPRSRVIASINVDEVEAMEYYVKNPTEFLPPPELPPLPPIVPDVKGPLPAPETKPATPGTPTTPAPAVPAPTTPGTPATPAAPAAPAPPAVPVPAKPSGSSLLNASGDLAASTPCVEEAQADSTSLLNTAFQATNPAPPATGTSPAPAAPAAPSTTPAAPATGTQPAATPPATPTTPAVPAATTPAAPAVPAVPKPDPTKPEAFEKVKARIINKLAEKKADEKIHEILRWAMADLNTQAIRIKKNELSYLVIDNAAGLHDLQKLQADIQAQFKLLPDYVRPADKWLSMADLGSMAGIGKSTIRTSATGAAIAAVDYIGSAKELLTELSEEKINRAKQKELAGTYKLQLHAAGQPLKDADGNVYIFRLVAGEPTRQANNLDEVRAEVVKDVKSLKAFEALKTRGDALAADARKEGLEKFAKAHVSTLERTVEFSRRVEKRSIRFNPMARNGYETVMKLTTPDLPHVGVSDQFLDQVFSMASAIVAAGGIDKAPPEKLVGFITVETGLKACVVKVTKITQVDTDQYKEKLRSLQQYIAEGDVKSRKSNPLSIKNLKKQLGFKNDESAGGIEADKKDQEEPDDQIIQQEEPDFELPF